MATTSECHCDVAW